jgi:hypothetical protein
MNVFSLIQKFAQLAMHENTRINQSSLCPPNPFRFMPSDHLVETLQEFVKFTTSELLYEHGSTHVSVSGQNERSFDLFGPLFPKTLTINLSIHQSNHQVL